MSNRFPYFKGYFHTIERGYVPQASAGREGLLCDGSFIAKFMPRILMLRHVYPYDTPIIKHKKVLTGGGVSPPYRTKVQECDKHKIVTHPVVSLCCDCCPTH